MRTPKMLRTLSLGYLGKRLLSELTGLRDGLERQNLLLTRLVDHFAPDLPVMDQQDLQRVGSVDHVNETEMGLVLTFMDRVQREQGRPPTEDEILRYLAEESTVDLQQRLTQQDQADALRRMGRL